MRDPVEERADGGYDLYDIATWEPRTALDRLAVRVYRGIVATLRAVLILLALIIMGAQIVLGGIGATFANDLGTVGLVVLSVVPALGLALYVYLADITSGEPLDLLVSTFILGMLFAGFAAIVNSALQPVLGLIPAIGMVLFFYLVVGPVEETVKLLAVRLHAYRSSKFDAVVDGAVYGAAAGLGFATIENALYITRNLGATGASEAATLGAVGVAGIGVLQLGGLEQIFGEVIGAGGGITAYRALAGPGHVIYSAFAGYYLGLAKFNKQRAGPIVVKGLLIAAFIHATYNTLVGIIPPIAAALTGTSPLLMFFGFVIVYDGVFGLILIRKLSRYRNAYQNVHEQDTYEEYAVVPERDEFDS
jgi:RsiW-degrading membrane proteinase PrsW (M82 family)